MSILNELEEILESLLGKTAFEMLGDKRPDIFLNDDQIIVTDDEIDVLVDQTDFLDYNHFPRSRKGYKVLNIDWMNDEQLNTVSSILINNLKENSDEGKNGYIAFYKGKQIEVFANTSYEAQKKAAEKFKAKKTYDVTVKLAQKDGQQVTHKPLD
jgi:hypothetical protein